MKAAEEDRVETEKSGFLNEDQVALILLGF